jgi:ATP-dependent DNA helicase RecG
MRAHDLVEPQLSTDAQSFVVSLQHRSVFSDEDQRWIEAYEHFELERDEKKVLLLGRAGAPLSVKQIMDTVDLVDTEDYRALIERLQQKGLIQGVKKGRGRTRNSPRWKVVQPKDANRYYGELLQGAQETYSGGHLGRRDVTRIAGLISDGNPYNAADLGAIFRRLRLTDAAGYPTGRLKAVLDSKQTLANAPARREPEPTRALRRPRADRPSTPRDESDALATVVREDEVHEVNEVMAQREPTKVFVGNLAYETGTEALRGLFSKVGEVVHVSVPRDYAQPGRNQGYGFVEMATSENAKRARSELESAELDGRRLRMDWAKS